MKRQTKQKQTLLEVFQSSTTPLSAQEAWEVAKKDFPKIGLATIYRLLEEFLKQKLLKTVEIGGKAKKYTLLTPEHYHYFECNSCHELFPVDKCPPNLRDLLPPNFTIESHEILLFGRCPNCKTTSKR